MHIFYAGINILDRICAAEYMQICYPIFRQNKMFRKLMSKISLVRNKYIVGMLIPQCEALLLRAREV